MADSIERELHQTDSKTSKQALATSSRNKWNSLIERVNKSNIIKLGTYKHPAETNWGSPTETASRGSPSVLATCSRNVQSQSG